MLWCTHTDADRNTKMHTDSLLLFLSLSKKEVLKVCFIMLNWSQ